MVADHRLVGAKVAVLDAEPGPRYELPSVVQSTWNFQILRASFELTPQVESSHDIIRPGVPVADCVAPSMSAGSREP